MFPSTNKIIIIFVLVLVCFLELVKSDNNKQLENLLKESTSDSKDGQIGNKNSQPSQLNEGLHRVDAEIGIPAPYWANHWEQFGASGRLN